MASTLQMNLVCALPLVAAISVVVVSSLPHSEEQQPRRLRRATSISRIRSRGPASRQFLSDGDGWLAYSFGESTDQTTPRPSLIKIEGNSPS